jgi:hypothetical protein
VAARGAYPLGKGDLEQGKNSFRANRARYYSD